MRGFDDLELYPPGDLELDAFDDDFFPADDDRAGLSPTVAPVAATVGVLLLPAAPAAVPSSAFWSFILIFFVSRHVVDVEV